VQKKKQRLVGDRAHGCTGLSDERGRYSHSEVSLSASRTILVAIKFRSTRAESRKEAIRHERKAKTEHKAALWHPVITCDPGSLPGSHVITGCHKARVLRANSLHGPRFDKNLNRIFRTTFSLLLHFPWTSLGFPRLMAPHIFSLRGTTARRHRRRRVLDTRPRCQRMPGPEGLGKLNTETTYVAACEPSC